LSHRNGAKERGNEKDAPRDGADQEMHPIYEARLLTHLKLSDHRLGFLVNWNAILIKDGIKGTVNRLRAGRWSFFALLAPSR
jgi:hypothetical protein